MHFLLLFIFFLKRYPNVFLNFIFCVVSVALSFYLFRRRLRRKEMVSVVAADDVDGDYECNVNGYVYDRKCLRWVDVLRWRLLIIYVYTEVEGMESVVVVVVLRWNRFIVICCSCCVNVWLVLLVLTCWFCVYRLNALMWMYLCNMFTETACSYWD